MASKQYHPFETFPPEVRLQIFGYLLPLNQVFVIRRDDRAPSIGQARRLTANNQTRFSVYGCLLIDRRTTSEALVVIYSCNIFTFNDPWLIETFMVRIGLANLRRITHIEVQSSSLNRANNNARTSTIFSTISDNFTGLQTLRLIGVGRGKVANRAFEPLLWLPSHLDRLEFITSLSGVLRNAQVYCDREEHNTRLLCNGAKYRTEWDELEVDMRSARHDMKNEEILAKKRKVEQGDAKDGGEDAAIAKDKAANNERKRPKVGPVYGWKR